MTPYQSETDFSLMRPLLRSLLQKSVRRGYEDLSQKVAFTLASRGDSAWLHARAGVIVFEECWPCAHLLNSGTPSVLTLREVAVSFKNKDAAGLGALAHAALGGDVTAIKQAHDPIAVKIVTAALKRPEGFFKWALAECSCESQTAVVLAARSFFVRASWPWDKAFMAAGAYLSCQKGTPQVSRCDQLPKTPFPFWSAVDKHTPQGKIALRRVASALHLQELQLQWASFYFESAKTNILTSSPWWECEVEWRLSALGLSLKEAEEMWVYASPHIQRAVQEQASALLDLVGNSSSDALF